MINPNNTYGKKYVLSVKQNAKSGTNNKILSKLILFFSKQVNCKILIIKITIKSWPALSVPYSAIRLKDKLKNIKAKRYKYFKNSLLDFELIYLNKK